MGSTTGNLKIFYHLWKKTTLIFSYHCELRWLSRGKVLQRFFHLRDAISTCLDMKGRPEPKLQDPCWIADLAFLLDITNHLNTLNMGMQGENQYITDMSDKISAFKKMLELWEDKLSHEDTAHFP
jgi:hypothetical protein